VDANGVSIFWSRQPHFVFVLVVLALAKRRATSLQITTQHIMKDKPVNVHNLCEEDEVEWEQRKPELELPEHMQ
jgi:hypothetical protein